ncbi:NAD-dependent epimerase/dehydratase family protein [Pseudomonas hefeiensis]|uniref:NAD-dependent epimerase/dehydratase family protein n=1 Tax=Pseudomonas hefeiensis TaxID=2738125 RepID=A0ABY9GGH7_9PSED|nr:MULTISPECIES: NAD-dependent epimerase/dehydratase family protein [unclassified Pseudomonas]WLH14750.1 NAD-dependent epimerase/dehydratase family protein [Pseudomonas sp. FP205]WLI42077.1 NAD-dependent epimerase/dehydratase family protein [Pseudomonas sp. FP821]
MRILVTGANGFIGRILVQRLLATGVLRGTPISTLILLDKELSDFPEDNRLRRNLGSASDAALLRRILADGIDVVFHLVSIPGGAAEAHYAQGYEVNLLASLELLEQLRQQPARPVLIYASSVAVYGPSLAGRMDESARACPELSYGSHKLMVEVALNDLARRGEVDGRALRLPGIVARPRAPNGLRSAFMSDLLHAFAAGEPYCCPVSPQATAWWMSVRCCVDNLLHAAEVDEAALGGQRVWQLPLLHLSIAQIIDALAAVYGDQRRGLITFASDEGLEALFGRFPAMSTPKARALGLRHDGSAAALVRNALNPFSRTRRAHRVDDPAGVVAHEID